MHQYQSVTMEAKLTSISKIIAIFICVIAFGIAIYNFRADTEGQSRLPVVAITQIATHPALDQVREGIIAGLEDAGFNDGQNIEIIFKNANGDGSLTTSIAQEFVRMNASVIVPISTPSSLAVATSTDTIPIVFSGVTDPVTTGLVNNLENPGKNITGVSDRWPFNEQVATFLEYFPDVKVVGMVFTRGDDVSEIGVNAMKILSSELGFDLELRAVSSASDIFAVTQALFRDVDAIYTGIDHLVLENMEGLVKASNEANKPLFGGESGSVEKGAVLAVSINMLDFGRLTAESIAQVLNGENPGAISIKTVSNGDLLVNREAANKFNLDIDSMIKAGAKVMSND